MTSTTIEQPLLVQAGDGVVTFVLDRPQKLNAISYEMLTQLQAQLDALATRPDIACVVLAGAGRSFSAGFDLETLPDDPDKLRFMAAVIDALEAFPRPTIAKLHGHCLTGALELAMACDILVASEDATFADTHSRWGIVPVCGMSVRLPERIGKARAKLLGFSGRRIDAATAATWGLVDLVADDLDGAVDELVTQVQSNSADANRILKALIHASQDDDTKREQKLADERGLRLGIPADRMERLSAGKGR
jgi:enoyl-CoA hydratase